MARYRFDAPEHHTVQFGDQQFKGGEEFDLPEGFHPPARVVPVEDPAQPADGPQNWPSNEQAGSGGEEDIANRPEERFEASDSQLSLDEPRLPEQFHPSITFTEHDQ